MTSTYFKTLNYSLGNEDTAFEMSVLEENARHVLVVAGSGSRVLPLFAKHPKCVSIVDIATEQLWLTELRVEAARMLTHHEYLDLFGYPREGSQSASRSRRKNLYKKVDTHGRMTVDARGFCRHLLESRNWDSPLYTGNWEQTFIRLSRLNRHAVGQRALKIFECRTLTQQRDFFRRHFPRVRFDLILMLLGNARVFNDLLYKGNFPRHNLNDSFFRLYQRSFLHLFLHGIARENYFLQLLFLGELVYPEGNPIECRADVYALLQDGVRSAKIEYLLGDACSIGREAMLRNGPIDFVSLSDIPSYLSGAVERNFMQTLAPVLAPNAHVVTRNYIHVPENPDLTGYIDDVDQYAQLVDSEKIQVYDIHVYRNIRKRTPV